MLNENLLVETIAMAMHSYSTYWILRTLTKPAAQVEALSSRSNRSATSQEHRQSCKLYQ